jgi:hypothetical protein
VLESILQLKLLLHISNLPEDMIPLGKFLLNEYQDARKEIDLLRVTLTQGTEHAELWEEICPQIESVMREYGGDPEVIEETALNLDEHDWTKDIEADIRQSQETARKSLRLLCQLRTNRFSECLHYLESFLEYRRKVMHATKEFLPAYKLPPARQELVDANDRQLQSFVLLLRSKITTPV